MGTGIDEDVLDFHIKYIVALNERVTEWSLESSWRKGASGAGGAVAFG
jgi:hypothetical protein